jgi:hypothetical protein
MTEVVVKRNQFGEFIAEIDGVIWGPRQVGQAVWDSKACRESRGTRSYDDCVACTIAKGVDYMRKHPLCREWRS